MGLVISRLFMLVVRAFQGLVVVVIGAFVLASMT